MTQFVSNLYKSVDITSGVLSQLIDDYQEGDIYGYFLIDGKLVPKSFVIDLHHHLCDISFDYGHVRSVEKILGEQYWASLTDLEKSVAGACILIIIENGYSVPVLEEFQHKRQ